MIDETDVRLARRLHVGAIVAAYEQTERDVRRSFELASGAERALNEAFGLKDDLRLEGDCWHRLPFDDVELTLTKLRRRVWGILVDRLELRRMMSIAAWEALDKQIREADVVPEITVASLNAMVKQFHDALPEMLEAAVEEVFNWLRPPGSHYKTNTELEIGERVVLEGMVERGFTYWRLKYSDRDAHLTALENVFTALDGKGQVTKGHYSEISEAIQRTARTERECRGETEYFAFRGFMRGTLHLRFKRLDLLKRLNEIAGGKRLRPRAAAE